MISQFRHNTYTCGSTIDTLLKKDIKSKAMNRVDPTTLYTTDELRSLLKGFVSLETLKKYGLAGSPGRGYWGQNVVDALNNYWHHLVRQRAVPNTERMLRDEPWGYFPPHGQPAAGLLELPSEIPQPDLYRRKQAQPNNRNRQDDSALPSRSPENED